MADFLAPHRLLQPTTMTVHQLQVVDDELPECAHELSMDMIAAFEGVIPCDERRRPPERADAEVLRSRWWCELWVLVDAPWRQPATSVDPCTAPGRDRPTRP